MGVWLEALETRRAERKSKEEPLQETPCNRLEFFLRDAGESEDRIDAYEEFFLSLKAAICTAHDIEQSCHQFNRARSMAMDLLGR